MLIVLEGPRGAGKSQIAQKLHMRDELPNALLLHRYAPEPDATWESEYMTPLDDYHPGGIVTLNPHVICDRWHIGEMVYPALWNRPSILGSQAVAEVTEMVHRKGGIIIHIDAPTEVVVSRRKTRGDTDVTYEEVAAERGKFRRAFASIASYPNYMYVTTDAVHRSYTSDADKVQNVNMIGFDETIDRIIDRAAAFDFEAACADSAHQEGQVAE